MSSHSSSGGRPTDEDAVRYFSRTDPVSLRVVEAVAAFHGVDPLELRPLAEHIDADALNALFSTVGDGALDGAMVTFRYEGARVTVTGRGDIDVVGADPFGRRE
ncbi:HalOD1 output domain-containing protein [Halopelagius fulvigenes]|uniref:HalOD1 output domain-containing protein n=1 Tax=Halopelagius fulvigenes TaxID=1198324 RepID=A0ABD5TTH6_9EURY